MVTFSSTADMYAKVQDNLAIMESSPNKEWCEKFLNFIMEPDVSKTISEAFPYTNPNTEALKLLGDEFLNNPAINPSQEAIAHGYDAYGQPPEVLARYDEIWTRFTE
jgi:spermidine/putrescine-binding protein